MGELHVLIDDKLKKEAEEILTRDGINSEMAITTFYAQIVALGHLPIPEDHAVKSYMNRKAIELMGRTPLTESEKSNYNEEWEPFDLDKLIQTPDAEGQ